MCKAETDNKTLPTSLPPIERQQKETQYPEWHKDNTEKGLWGRENNEWGCLREWGCSRKYRFDGQPTKLVHRKQCLIIIDDFDAG